jgi:hypothetical protein
MTGHSGNEVNLEPGLWVEKSIKSTVTSRNTNGRWNEEDRLSIFAESTATNLYTGLDPIQISPQQHAAVIVAHPDDETLWSGGMILTHPNYHWFITALCRLSDPDRSLKFQQALQSYQATGAMADLDDGVEQIPLPTKAVQKTILEVLPDTNYDLILTHAPWGEYTSHRRHEEVSKAVIDLWMAGTISSRGSGCCV